MFNNIYGIIQLQECPNVISAPECSVGSSQISVWNKLNISNFDKFCKHNMLGMHLDSNFQDLITNQKCFPFGRTATTCISLFIRCQNYPNFSTRFRTAATSVSSSEFDSLERKSRSASVSRSLLMISMSCSLVICVE